VVFNVYFAQRVVPPEGILIAGVVLRGPFLWSLAVALSTFVIFVLAPLLGAIADIAGRRKSFLAFFWALGALSTSALVFVSPGRVGLALALFGLANIGFAGGNIFYNAFLPALAPPERQGRLSGLGWAVGYLGSFLCLGLNLLLIRFPEKFHLPTAHDAPVRAGLLLVGLWWGLFGWPLLRWGPRDRAAGPASLGTWARRGWERLARTGRELGRHKNLWTFMAAFALYNDGIETVIVTASLVGAGLLGMSPGELILCFLMIQAVAFLGALVLGRAADRVGSRRVILATLAVYVGVLFKAYFLESKSEFWALGVVLGFVLGGSQAASRSLMSRLVPAGQSAEFFSFYGVVAKFTAIAGPLVFGAASQVWGLRAATLSLLPFFVLGGALLIFVRDDATPPPAR
jgi:UMF1 family MFS transporter